MSKAKMVSTCPMCGKGLANASSLNRHYREQHEDPQQYMCTQCPKPKRFKNKRSFNDHVKLIHEGQGPQCGLCFNFFLSVQKLEHHEQKCREGKSTRQPGSASLAAAKKAQKEATRLKRNRAEEEAKPLEDEDDLGMISDEELDCAPPQCDDIVPMASMPNIGIEENIKATFAQRYADNVRNDWIDDGSEFFTRAKIVLTGEQNIGGVCEILSLLVDMVNKDPRCLAGLWARNIDHCIFQIWQHCHGAIHYELFSCAVDAITQGSYLASLRFALSFFLYGQGNASEIPGKHVRTLVGHLQNHMRSSDEPSIGLFLKNNIVWYLTEYAFADGFMSAPPQSPLFVHALFVVLAEQCLRIGNADLRRSSVDPKKTLEVLNRCLEIVCALYPNVSMMKDRFQEGVEICVEICRQRLNNDTFAFASEAFEHSDNTYAPEASNAYSVGLSQPILQRVPTTGGDYMVAPMAQAGDVVFQRAGSLVRHEGELWRNYSSSHHSNWTASPYS